MKYILGVDDDPTVGNTLDMDKRCTKCKQDKPTDNFSPGKGWCKSCCNAAQKARVAANPDRAKEISRASYHRRADRLRAEMRVRFKTDKYRKRAVEYAKANPQYKQRYAEKLRRDVIGHYGGKCAACGETNEHFLVIDHIADDGAEHRRTVIVGGIGGNTFYRKIRRAGYPVGLQVLCANCNWRKEVERRSRMGTLNRQRTHYRRLRIEVIGHYGGSCVCCDETDLTVLTLDHEAGDGADHRRRLMGNSKSAGVAFYRKVRDTGYPTGLRVLCWNCNSAVGRFGRCPHPNGVIVTPPNSKPSGSMQADGVPPL